MGSDSDLPALVGCIKRLKAFGIETEVRVISAHRTPEAAADFAKGAQSRGIGVIIGAAGKAAHLPGVLAAYTTLPVIGVPIKSQTLSGIDALLSIVQMPGGVPVATVAIDGGENAAILAAQILALSHRQIAPLLTEYKKKLAEDAGAKDAGISKKAEELLKGPDIKE